MAASSQRRLRELLRAGRISLVIGLACLIAAVAGGELARAWIASPRLAGLIGEGLLIGGWVAMWRPMEIFLYDWWPLRAEARRHARLAAMPVELHPGRAGA